MAQTATEILPPSHGAPYETPQGVGIELNLGSFRPGDVAKYISFNSLDQPKPVGPFMHLADPVVRVSDGNGGCYESAPSFEFTAIVPFKTTGKRTDPNTGEERTLNPVPVAFNEANTECDGLSIDQFFTEVKACLVGALSNLPTPPVNAKGQSLVAYRKGASTDLIAFGVKDVMYGEKINPKTGEPYPPVGNVYVWRNDIDEVFGKDTGGDNLEQISAVEALAPGSTLKFFATFKDVTVVGQKFDMRIMIRRGELISSNNATQGGNNALPPRFTPLAAKIPTAPFHVELDTDNMGESQTTF